MKPGQIILVWLVVAAANLAVLYVALLMVKLVFGL